MERFPLSNDKKIEYKVIIKYETGEVETLDINADEYLNYKIGQKYTYSRYKFSIK